VAMVGTREAQPIGQVKPNFFMPITIRIGRPMAFERQRERADDPQVLRSITDEVMFELRELSGQEYVNTYAKRKDTVEAADEAKVKSIVDVTDGAQSPSVAVAG
ncbi:MAG: 1-acyl-sn-glycerol-3-phosphate acyltransferase, partial [Actinobacteria bacterium]|nr:1-acyl-sn-glycerol-3-phosphate acyltransferase [Actinomycetota bacterium]